MFGSFLRNITPEIQRAFRQQPQQNQLPPLEQVAPEVVQAIAAEKEPMRIGYDDPVSTGPVGGPIARSISDAFGRGLFGRPLGTVTPEMAQALQQQQQPQQPTQMPNPFSGITSQIGQTISPDAFGVSGGMPPMQNPFMTNQAPPISNTQFNPQPPASFGSLSGEDIQRITSIMNGGNQPVSPQPVMAPAPQMQMRRPLFRGFRPRMPQPFSTGPAPGLGQLDGGIARLLGRFR